MCVCGGGGARGIKNKKKELVKGENRSGLKKKSQGKEAHEQK